MRLNIGCGEFPAPGWVNIDMTHEAADVRHDATTGLPVFGEPISRIYAGHVLEHLAFDDVPDILRRWRDDPEVYETTQLAVVGPDCDRGLIQLREGRIDQDQYDQLDVRKGRWPGEDHLWRCTEALAVDVVRAGDWEPRVVTLQELADDGWPLTSLIGWQFALLATPA